MSASSTPTPEGPGSVSGAPNLPAGFTDTFTSHYIDAGGVRQHAVIGGDGPPLLLVLDTTIAENQQRMAHRLTIPVLGIGGAYSLGAGAAAQMRLVADNVQSAVVPGAGHFVAEEAPTEMLAALTTFMAPYHESASTQQTAAR